MRSNTALGFAACLAAVSLTALAYQPADPGPRAPQPPSTDQPVRQPGRGGPGARGENPGVGPTMKSMNRALRSLRDQIADNSKKDENLRFINDIQRGCVISKGQPVPADILRNAPDDAGRAKFADTYRRSLMASLRILLDIEQDIIDGKGDAAKSHLDALVKLRDDVHDQLGVKED